jgi:hypothetical protein
MIITLVPGLEVVDDLLSANEKKLIFVSVWFSFTVALYLLNRCRKQPVNPGINWLIQESTG